MTQRMRNSFTLLMALACLGLSGCFLAAEGELVYVPNPPDKTPLNSPALVRVAHFVDTSRPEAAAIIESTLRYTLAKTGTLYFDYVVLSGGEIKQGDINAYTVFSPELAAILNNRPLIQSLRDRAVRVVVSVTGGGDGVSFGSLSTEGEQLMYARGLGDACKYYEFDGIEIYDRDCEKPGRDPYPKVGQDYWNGDTTVFVADDQALAEALKEGGGYYANMLSYLIEALGASTSFQGDTDPAIKETKPVLMRETGFGQYLPATPPRHKFDSTSFYLTYSVNDTGGVFGAVQRGLYRESYMEFMGKRQYAPIQLDLSSISDTDLRAYSELLGRSFRYETETVEIDGEEEEIIKRDENGDPLISTRLNDAQYGFLYYFNLTLPSPAQTDRLSITAGEVFGDAVICP